MKEVTLWVILFFLSAISSDSKPFFFGHFSKNKAIKCVLAKGQQERKRVRRKRRNSDSFVVKLSSHTHTLISLTHSLRLKDAVEENVN